LSFHHLFLLDLLPRSGATHAPHLTPKASEHSPKIGRKNLPYQSKLFVGDGEPQAPALESHMGIFLHIVFKLPFRKIPCQALIFEGTPEQGKGGILPDYLALVGEYVKLLFHIHYSLRKTTPLRTGKYGSGKIERLVIDVRRIERQGASLLE